MKRLWGVVPFALLIFVVCLPACAKKQLETFSGTYDWEDEVRDAISAQFISSGEGTWKVKFRFRWGEGTRIVTGTAEGSLAEGGDLKGMVISGDRRWVFEATVRDGVMRGKHARLWREGNRTDTGTFELVETQPN